MIIVDAYDYILGRKFLGVAKREPFRGSKDTLKLGKELLNKHTTSKSNLNVLEVASAFYKAEPDFAHDVPPNQREEVFYALKLNFVSPIVPAKILFLIEKTFSLYGTLNLIPKVFPKSDLDDLFAEGYLQSGYTLRDVLCTLYDEKYMPLSIGNLAVPNKENWDIYIKETDMVAIVPSQIKERLTQDDILKLSIKNKRIMLGDKELRFIGDYYGAVNSCYDLSGIV